MRWNNPDWAVKEKAIYRYNIQLPRVEGGGLKRKKNSDEILLMYVTK